MKNQQQKFLKYFSALVFSSLLFAGAEEMLLHGGNFYISELAPDKQYKDLYSGFEESEENPLFNSNPMEILDIWRRTTAMEDATAPSDALDEAIKAFEGKELVNYSDD